MRGESCHLAPRAIAHGRLVSAQLGRPLGVDDTDIDVTLPVAMDDEALTKLPKTQYDAPDTIEEPHASTISGFIALTKLCKIAGRVAHLLYRPSNGKSVSDPSWAASQQNHINKLDKTLKDWLDNEVVSRFDPHWKMPVLIPAVQVQGPIHDRPFGSARLGRSIQRILCRFTHAAPKLPPVQSGLSATAASGQLAIALAPR